MHQWNYISSYIPHILCLMYADDVANCADTVVNFQKQLNVIDEFCIETNISVNLKKKKPNNCF